MNKVDHGTNDHGLLARVLGRLQDAGLSPLVFGGWAQELLQLCRRGRMLTSICCFWPIRLVLSINLCLQQRAMRWSQIKAKRFAHKRACIAQSVMVELTLGSCHALLG